HAEGSKMNRPAIGTLHAKPVTPHPPSSSLLKFRDSVSWSNSLIRDAIIFSAKDRLCFIFNLISADSYVIIRLLSAIIQVTKHVSSAYQFSDTGHPQSVKYLLQLFSPTMKHVDYALRSPGQIHQSDQFKICRSNTSSASTAAFTSVASHTFQGHKFGSDCDNAIGAKSNGL